MSDSPAFSVLALPPELEANELLGCFDQMAARVDAVVVPRGKKKRDDAVELPAGVQALDALPALLAAPWKRLQAAVGALRKFRQDRATAQADKAHAAGDTTEQDLANVDCDDRWRAFEQWTGGNAALADDGKAPSPAEAKWLYAQLFPSPDGLRFITRRPRVQWAAMVPRMEVLAGERAQAIVKGFGGARHYQQLVAAHERFGAAFGFKAVVVDEPGGPTDGRPQWTTARDAFRTWIQKIEVSADPELEGSEPLARFLLAPYVEMVTDFEKGRRPRKKAEPEPTPPKG